MNDDIKPVGKGKWRLGYAQRPLRINDDQGTQKGTVPAGRLFRVFLGQLVKDDPSTQSPTPSGRYAIEMAPPKNGFWASYPTALFAQILAEQGAEFAADSPARLARAGWTDAGFDLDAAFDAKGAGKITGNELNANPQDPLVIPDLPVVSPSEGGFPWWLVVVGVGAVVLLSRKPARGGGQAAQP